MKKIYASMLVLAMGTCITAGARAYQRANISFDGVAQVKTFQTVDKMMSTDKVISKNVAKVKANAGEEWNNLGQGIFIDDIFGLGQINVTVEESASTAGYYRVPDAFTQFAEGANPFVVDATDPNFVYIPDQETGIEITVNFTDGTSISGPLTLLSYSQFAMLNDITPEEFMAAYPQYVITMEDGIVNMPAGSILGNIGDEIWQINTSDMVLALPGAQYVPEWGEVATGQMLDTFFEAGFNGYVAQECDVLVQKNNKVDGVYRIIDPWYRLFDEEAPSLDAGYYFYIDASNPACVVVPYQTSYVRTSDGPVYIMSMSANYETTEEFLASEDAGCNFTMDMETRTINMTGSEVQLTDGSTTFVGPLFFVYPQSSNPNGMYVLRPYDTPGWIKIPEYTGINSVAVDNSNANVEYYNIQGVRVDNPVAGQLYIVKKGNEVSKQIIR